MSALATRAELVAERNYYLMPLPRTGDSAEQIEAWIEDAVLGKPVAESDACQREGQEGCLCPRL